MAASQEQKVDFLLKKIGYVASKTGIAEDESSLTGTKKAPFGEAIPSPLVVPATNMCADSSLIPTAPPGSTGAIVRVYLAGTSGHRMTADSTISGNRTFIAYSTYNDSSTSILGNWISTPFGADYIVKVYKGDPNSGGVQLSSAGSGSDDTWFFDYSSGVLNFNGTSAPAGVTSSNIYIVGYRYVGGIGISPAAGFGTFSSLNVSGISTFAGLVDANGGVTANTLIVEDLTDNRVVIAGTGGELEDDANLTFNGTTLAVGVNLDVDGQTDLDVLNVAEGATFSDIVYLNGTVSAASSTGVNGQVLRSTGVGVTWTTLPAARTNSIQTATQGQTSFNFNYNVGYIDVFYNGVKLASSEFTASNGSTIVLGDIAYAGDIIELISYNTVSGGGGGGGGATILSDLTDVTITGTPIAGDTLQHNGTAFVNDYTITTTTTSTSEVTLMSLDISVYRSVEYTIQVTEGSNYHVTKILAMHNGTASAFNEYGTLINNTSVASFDVDVSGSNMRLRATPAGTNSTVFKVKFDAIKV